MGASPESGGSKSRKLLWAIALVGPLFLIPAVVALSPERPPRWHSASGVLLLILVATASWTDLKAFRIPNWITYPGILWGLIINGISEFVSPEVSQRLGAVGIADSLLGGLLPFVVMLVIFSMTGGGAGDVKLVAAIGFFLGLSLAIAAILCSFICAGGFALIRCVWIEGPLKMSALMARAVGNFLLPLYVAPLSEADRRLLRSPMPLAPSFALGTALIELEWVSGDFFL